MDIREQINATTFTLETARTRRMHTPPETPPSPRLVRYIQPLPLLDSGIQVAVPSALNSYSFTLREIRRQLHPQLPPTPLWALDDGTSLPGQAGLFGMVVAAQCGVPLDVRYLNALPAVYPPWLPVDIRLSPTGNQLRTLIHLHGAVASGDSDGNPAATPQGYAPGQVQVAHYSNEEPRTRATLLWFHDHPLGNTRLNVLAGLVAGYLVRDLYDTGTEPNPVGIPGGGYEILLVLQDRQFNADGTFRYPRGDLGVAWSPEYFGDVMLVNGKVWPYLEVEPRLYRFRILNACSARIVDLAFNAPTWQIGGDQGMFDVPVAVEGVVMASSERVDLVVDFSGSPGATLLLQNREPQPPVVTPAPPLPDVMQIRVGRTVSTPGPAAVPPVLAGGERAQMPPPMRTRYLTLNEVASDTPDWFLNIDGLHFEAPITETPQAGAVEDWVFINLTEDTHPLHLHLVKFEVIGRTPFDEEAYEAEYGGPNGVPGGIDPTPFATGPMEPPEPGERGYKDTVKVNPRTFTTIRMRFTLPRGVPAPQFYAHHCHILEHEDNDMMRPFEVVP